MKTVSIFSGLMVLLLVLSVTPAYSGHLLHKKDYLGDLFDFEDEATHLYKQGEQKKAAELWGKECKSDVARACYMMGMLHYYGKGVTKNLNTAVKYWKKACEQKQPSACFEAGVYYEKDKELTQENLQIASDFYEAGCKYGQDEACYNLQRLIEKKKFKAKNPDTLVKTYQYSCDYKNYESCVTLGLFYMNGEEGLAIDYKKALALQTLACENGSPMGCNNLGYLYATGKGTKLDFSKAKPLFEIACNANVPLGCKNLEELLEKESKSKQNKNRTPPTDNPPAK